MEDVLHPIFDLAWELTGPEGLADGDAARLAEALAAIQAPGERADAVVALVALAEVLRRRGESTAAQAIQGLAAATDLELVQEVLRTAVSPTDGGARYAGLTGAPRARFQAPEAPKAGAVRVGVGVRFRLNT